MLLQATYRRTWELSASYGRYGSPTTISQVLFFGGCVIRFWMRTPLPHVLETRTRDIYGTSSRLFSVKDKQPRLSHTPVSWFWASQSLVSSERSPSSVAIGPAQHSSGTNTVIHRVMKLLDERSCQRDSRYTKFERKIDVRSPGLTI